MVMENEEPTRSDNESLPSDEDDLQGVSSSPTCQSQSHDGSLGPPQLNKSKEIMGDLELGMEFCSKESAYDVYCNYARDKGFDVRKHHWKKNNAGIVTRVTYTCSRQGFRRNDEPIEGTTYTQPVSRVGCQAHMTCLLKKNGKFKIVSFDVNHNHALVRTLMKHMLKINRKMSRAQKAHVDDADKSGIPIKATMELMSREVGGRENLGFLDKDYRNYICQKRKTNMEKGDAGAILQYFHKMQVKDSSSFYSVQLDEDDMITNMFWADSRSISDNGLFGDVICFDTTYRTNEYGRPFAPILGVNHHKQTVVFGAALLYEESADSFTWLFEIFLEAMSGKQPKTILTDQSVAMAKAILEVFNESHHRLCVWHIYQNAAKNLSHVFNRSSQFASDFGTCVYGYEDKEEWLYAWNDMIEKYDLKGNKWLKDLFAVKEKWALVYGRHIFTADMMSTQRSESMNNVLKKYLKPSHNLLRFFEHYEGLLEDRRYQELIAYFKMMQTIPMLLTNVEMLRHAAEIYAPEVYKLFQREYMCILNYNIYKVSKSGMTYEYKVTYNGKPQEHFVKFEALTEGITCSCMKFSFVGILCRHALKVLDKKNVKRIPHDYILKRWTRDAKGRCITNYRGGEGNDHAKESMGRRYSHLCRNFREIASLAAEHEKFTTYAHECLVDMLKGLEELKKSFCQDNTCTNKTSEGQASVRKSGAIKQEGQILDGESVASEQKCQVFDDESGASEHKEMIQLDDECEITARGVKRKATVGRPRNRYKDPLERRAKPQTKATKSSTRKGTRLKDCAPFSGNSNEQQVIRHGYPMFNVLTQGPYMNVGTQVSFPSTNIGVTNQHGSMPFTKQKFLQLQGSCIENGTQAPFFGPFTNSQNSIPFTNSQNSFPLIQQFQEVIMHHHDLSQSNNANKGLGK